MSILVIKVPNEIITGCSDSHNAFIEQLQKAADLYFKEGNLTLILPDDDMYLVELEGSGEIKEFRIECYEDHNHTKIGE